MISCHSLETLLLDERPELEEGTMNYDGIELWVFYLGEEILSDYNLHRMALSGSDENMMLFLKELKPFLVVTVDNLTDSLLIDVFMAFASEILHDFLKRDEPTGVYG